MVCDSLCLYAWAIVGCCSDPAVYCVVCSVVDLWCLCSLWWPVELVVFASCGVSKFMVSS
jgi:hypothetical protein